MSKESLTASLKFLEWQSLYEEEKPFQVFINIPKDAEDQRDTNLVFEDVEIKIDDVRSADKEFSVDKTGFEFKKHITSVTDFTNRKIIEEVYLPEIETLLRNVLDSVDRVYFFDWRLRKNEPEIEGATIDLNDLTNWLRPAMHVHVDQSPSAALNRVRLHFGEEADYLLRGRVRIINTWRPLIPSVEDWPLAVCDSQSVSKKDLVECDHVRRHYMGSTMYLLKNPKHKFYYMSHQGKDDALIFKQFDSANTVRGKYAPHASFKHPAAKSAAIPRQSIEVRALVFTYPEQK